MNTIPLQVFIDQQGRAVARTTGGSYTSGNLQLLRRIQADGSVDTSFADHGVSRTTKYVYKTAMRSDGSFISVRVDPPSEMYFTTAVDHYDSNYVRIYGQQALNYHTGNSENVRDVIVTLDNAFLVLMTLQPTELTSVIARITEPYELDTSFGTDGYFVDPGAPGSNEGKLLAVFPNNDILLVQLVQQDPETWMLQLRRLAPDGTLLTDWGVDGLVQHPVLNPEAPLFLSPKEVKMGTDGSFLLLYRSLAPNIGDSPEYRYISRFDHDGSIDPGFGQNGYINSPGIDGSNIDHLEQMLILPDQRLLVVETNGIDHTELQLARYLPNGTPDPGFGINGKITVGTLEGKVNTRAGITLDPWGHVRMTGSIRRGLMDHKPWDLFMFILDDDFTTSTEPSRSPFQASINVHPNPTTGLIHLYMQMPEAVMVEVDLFDTSGGLISALFNGHVSSGQNLQLDLSPYGGKGVQLIRVRSPYHHAVLPVVRE